MAYPVVSVIDLSVTDSRASNSASDVDAVVGLILDGCMDDCAIEQHSKYRYLCFAHSEQIKRTKGALTLVTFACVSDRVNR